jgi:hypothetical protein
MKAPQPVVVVVGIASFAVASLGVHALFERSRREPDVPANLAGKAWVEQRIGGGFVLDVPWPLSPTPEPASPADALIQRSTVMGNETDGFSVQAMVATYREGVTLSIEGAADGALANIRTVQDTLSVDAEKHDTTIVGNRAIEIGGRIARRGGDPVQLRGVVFLHDRDMILVLAIANAGQPEADAAWRRMRDSIRAAPR